MNVTGEISQPRLGSKELGAKVCYGAAALLAALVVLAAAPPFFFAQPQAYHDYADIRVIAGVPFFWNVVSNVVMLAVGVAGLVFLRRRRLPPLPGALVDSAEVLPYAAFYVGAVASALGSAYYHARPEDATLLWDRLGMSVAFSSMMVAALVDRGPARLAARLWALTLAIAVGSVLFWGASGDLTPYLAAQVGALAIALAAVVASPGRYTRHRLMYVALALYVVASSAEKLDRPIYEWTGGFISGHTAKHYFAGLAMYVVYFMMTRRRVRS